MDLRNDPLFFNWRRDWWQPALAVAWLAFGYAILWRIFA